MGEMLFDIIEPNIKKIKEMSIEAGLKLPEPEDYIYTNFIN